MKSFLPEPILFVLLLHVSVGYIFPFTCSDAIADSFLTLFHIFVKMIAA